MENSIKDLIELATSSGTIKQESRDLIYQKAEEKGISKTECDIYIENALKTITNHDGDTKTFGNDIPANLKGMNGCVYIVVVVVLIIAYFAYTRYETDRIYDNVMDDSRQMQHDMERDMEREMEKYNNY